MFLRPDIAHLDHHERVLVRRAGREEYVGVQLARRSLDAVSDVLDEGCGGSAVESAIGIASVEAKESGFANTY